MAKKCVRCKDVLQDNYCVGCGIRYGDPAGGQIAQTDIKVEEQLERSRFWRNVWNALFWWWRFS